MCSTLFPDDTRPITPFLRVRDVGQLIAFLANAFDAEETMRIVGRDGRISHAEMRVAGALVVLVEASEQETPLPGVLCLNVTDAEAAHRRAVMAGAISVMEPTTMSYGDRQGGVKDPTGNLWWLATRVETVAPEEMELRTTALAGQPQDG